MRILFVSAFYPPHVVGGWEQLVEDINTGLQTRGYTTQVLTSSYGTGTAYGSESGVQRVLTLESNLHHYDRLQFFWGRKRRQRCNLRHTRDAINAFDPDVIFVHAMWNLWKGVPWLAEQIRPGRVVYYIADDWPYAPDVHTAYWRDPARKAALRLPKRLLATMALRMVLQEKRIYTLGFEHVLCVSQAVRENMARHVGISRDRMHVVYNGIDTDRFVPLCSLGSKKGNGRGLSLLYAGSLVPHKGVHIAVEAMAILAQDPALRDITLTIVGAGHPDYEARLKEIMRVDRD